MIKLKYYPTRMSRETPKPNAPPPIIVRNACIQHKKDYEKKKEKKKELK